MAPTETIFSTDPYEPVVNGEYAGVALQPCSTEPHCEVVNLFGCQLAKVRRAEAVKEVYRLMEQRGTTCRYVVTPNIDHVVTLMERADLRRAYADASLVVTDGMPVVLASRLLGRPVPERISGTDLLIGILAAAESHGGLRVYLLGAMPGVADQAAVNIERSWPEIEVVGTNSPPFGFEKDPEYQANLLEEIRNARPDLLVVGLGAPKQELWVHAHREEIDAAAVCIGASIDFIAGNKKRAPLWMQVWGLEWLHRMLTEPRRLFRRYLRDAWLFPPIVWREWRKLRKERSAH